MKRNKLTDEQRAEVLKRLDPFLRSVAVPESQEGKFTTHNILQEGLDKGKRAVGFTGLKPSLIQDVLKRYPTLREKYKGMTGDQVAALINEDPLVEPEIANAALDYTKRGLGRHDNPVLETERDLAYGWRHGRGAAINHPEKKLAKDDYSSEVNRLHRTRFPELIEKLSVADMKNIDERQLKKQRSPAE